MTHLAPVTERVARHENWLRENAPLVFIEQKHLTGDTQERAYWNYGYLVALRDVLKLLDAEVRT